MNENIKINLNDLVENMEQLSEDAKIYFSKKDGEFHYITGDIMSVAKNNGDSSNISEWEMDILETAKDIIENKQEYVLVPTVESISEIQIIEEFISTLSNKEIKDKLKVAINSNEGVRKFKNLLVELEIHNLWDEFLENYYINYGIQWCEENKLIYYMI